MRGAEGVGHVTAEYCENTDEFSHRDVGDDDDASFLTDSHDSEWVAV
jgi:hypothetical protein